MSSFHKAHPSAGARPGTLVIPANAPRPRLFVIEYTAERLEEREIAGVDALPAIPLPTGAVLWLDVRGFGDESLIRAVGARFGMTALALEDAINAPQRPKSELYASHQLLIARVPLVDDRGALTLPQVCLVLGERYVLTFQERYFGLFDPVRERIRDGVGRPLRSSGADYLAYALVDAMVDRYYPVVERLSNAIDDIEDRLLDEPEESSLTRLRQVRRRLGMLRRIALPQREMVSALQRESSPYVGPQVREFLRDTGDHIAQIAELVDASRESAAVLSEESMSMIAQKTNEVMKVLTLMASLFIPLTFIAGIYGMNFDDMPELHSSWGYSAVLSLMLLLAAAMLFYFRRRGWLGSGGRAKRSPHVT
jgi:magnesium transporter